MGNELFYFGQAYGTGSYSSCAYSEGGMTAGTCQTSSTGPMTGPGGQLAGTGTMLVLIATIAALLIFTALLVRIWKRQPTSRPVPQPVAIDEEEPPGLSRSDSVNHG